jgi:hypothetical protein
MAVRLDKSLCTVRHEARRQQVEEAIDDPLPAVRVCTNTHTDLDDANLLTAPPVDQAHNKGERMLQDLQRVPRR